jgi:hypothetical protein
MWFTLLGMVIALATPSPSPSPLPSPTASPAAALTEIGRTSTVGRNVNLVGTAMAASEGTIDQAQIQARPVLRPGEVLEDIPGLVISQHSGEGKANQYYLRGFQLDHGTDLAGTIAGIPVNLPTHAHGQGYSDVNWLMPELVSYVRYKKGPYAVDEGDFSTAGSYDLFYRNTISTVVSYGGGTDGYDRLFLAGSPQVGAGHLLYAFELFHDNGPFVNPDDYKKINGVLRWSRTTDASDFNVTAWGYRGDFNSSDQLPQREVDEGLISRFGAPDPSDGGKTYRYALSSEYARTDAGGTTRASVYAESYGLDLFSNFTYFQFDANDYYNVHVNPLTCTIGLAGCAPSPDHVTSYVSYCPANAGTGAFAYACGDQREQEDRRFVSGGTISRTMERGRATFDVGASVRNDNIYEVGLFLTQDRTRFANGTLSDDRVVERDTSLWASTTYRAGDRLRLLGGARFDNLTDDVTAFIPQNSGKSIGAMINPKFTAAYALSKHAEVYANAGESFHSNDGRGTTQTVDPQTRTTVDPTGATVAKYAPLVRAWGEETGVRYSMPRYTATLAFWKLNIASELVFDGDHGVTTPNGPTVRKGIEFTNFWTPRSDLTVFADIATSTARFTTDPDNLGTFVPESLNVVTSAGVSLDRLHYGASIDLRYFGPRVLDQAGDAVSAPSTLVDLQAAVKLGSHASSRLTFTVFNLLNAVSDDVEYFYQSWLPSDATNPATAALNPAYANPCQTSGAGCGVNDYHVHPSDSRQFRVNYSVRL